MKCLKEPPLKSVWGTRQRGQMKLKNYMTSLEPLGNQIEEEGCTAYVYVNNPEIEGLSIEKFVNVTDDDAKNIIQLLAGHYRFSPFKLFWFGLFKATHDQEWKQGAEEI